MVDEIWGEGIDGLRRECRSEHLVGSVLQEVRGPGNRRAERLDDFFPGCRLFRIDSEIRQGRDRGAIQRFFVLRPGDARAYQLHRDLDVLALARAENVRLDSPESALAFVGFALGLVLEEDEVAERHESAWIVDGTSDSGEAPLGERVILRLDADSLLVDVVRVGKVDAPEHAASEHASSASDGDLEDETR